MAVVYCCYEMLRQNEREGVDYEVVTVTENRDPSVVVMAPHGGDIEPHTSLLADEIATDEFVFYEFRGKKKSGNRTLHITSTRFDEPCAVGLAERAEVVLAVHGARGGAEFLMVGGTARGVGVGDTGVTEQDGDRRASAGRGLERRESDKHL